VLGSDVIRKKCIEKNEKLGVRLTPAERNLIVEDPIHIHDELADRIRATPTGAPVLLTLDDLEDLGGYVAAEANHTTDKKLRKKLDAIFSKIQDLLETHADEEPPNSLKIEDAQREKLVAEQTVQLRITLGDIEPAIWRLVEVPDCSLGELHEVIQKEWIGGRFNPEKFSVEAVNRKLGEHY